MKTIKSQNFLLAYLLGEPIQLESKEEVEKKPPHKFFLFINLNNS